MRRPTFFSLVMTREAAGSAGFTQMAGSSAVSPVTPVGTVSSVDGTLMLLGGIDCAGAMVSAVTAADRPEENPDPHDVPPERSARTSSGRGKLDRMARRGT